MLSRFLERASPSKGLTKTQTPLVLEFSSSPQRRRVGWAPSLSEERRVDPTEKKTRTFYRIRAEGRPEILRRYTHFMNLKAELKEAGLDRFKGDFPRKSSAGISRQQQLGVWLGKVMSEYASSKPEIVERFWEEIPGLDGAPSQPDPVQV